MDETARSGTFPAFAWCRLRQSLGAKLFGLLLLTMPLILGLLGWANVRLHRRNLEQMTLAGADRMGNVIKRTVTYDMMRNDRAALYDIIDTVGKEPGIVRLRIFNERGRISFSTDKSEIGHFVDKKAEACYACHPGEGVIRTPATHDRFRIFEEKGRRTLGIVTPIMNTPGCANASCHAHPASQTILGVIDTNMSLEAADASIRHSSKMFSLYSVAAIVVTLLCSSYFIWLFHRRVRTIWKGTRRLARGELGVQIPVTSRDELGELAASFNEMSGQLAEARREVTSWAHTLEKRVEEKTAQLQRVHEQMVQAEKLTSLGKLAAVVAHEINNPLSGILTYAKLLRKWIERGDAMERHKTDMTEALTLIEAESRRCGEIVRGLLTFGRAAPLNVAPVDLNVILQQCVKLVEHKLDLGSITLSMDLDRALPRVRGDAGQLEQLVLVLVMNAIEAMPREGVLRLTTETSADGSEVSIAVEDDGIGIPDELLPQLFEPFVTTKEQGGVGLGLAIAKGIVERHHGKISVESQVGRGTRFLIQLPVNVVPDSGPAAIATSAA